ncbi:3-phosphoinositide-dependent protein kinase [Trema orientale]|uniref:3-phosphoinositide-dependent protein kinase n=1 Tax=Trema orientale TaxID=63057 RepID=A0A2P5E759_TREOI|nr:3-phosphoinositide-dependent protein kinase [Trema orientale]
MGMEVEVGGSSESDSKIWEQIERSESYLVCSMFEEAASSASSVLNQLRDDRQAIATRDDIQFYDMLESTGMVLVQALNELGRVSEILNELKQSFSSVAAIPLQVLLTGACFQISQSPSGVRKFLEEFLSKWRLVDERYVLAGAEAGVDYVEGCGGHFCLGVDKYLDVVEVYVMKLLGATLNDIDFAISWVEKADLPEDRRQELLRRLHSLHSMKATTLSRGSAALLADNKQAHSSNLKQQSTFEGSPKVLDDNYPLNGGKTGKQAVLKLSKRVTPCLWWFRTINLKLGNAQVAISNGKIALGCLILLIYWIFRRRQTTLKGIVQRQALNIKKAMVDLWQLAFSYQVNPLAAVQSSPVPLRGGQR